MLRPSVADYHYTIAGLDLYQIQATSTVSRISYLGTERLSVRRDGEGARFEAHARYVRSGPDGQADADASFVAELMPDGSFDDRDDHDPDFLTVLNQPFAVQLDAATLRDLRQLHLPVPFAAASPLGGGTVLRGFLRPGPSGLVAGRKTVAVRFQAAGPMTGTLPGRNDDSITGHMTMDGTAYYALDDAMLLALHATLTIDARLREGQSGSVPVHIVYRRTIRAA